MMADIAANEYLEYGKAIFCYFYCLKLIFTVNINDTNIVVVQCMKESRKVIFPVFSVYKK